MRKLFTIVGALAISGASYLLATIRYYDGFDDGADSVLCVMAHQQDGPEAAMRGQACRNIANRTPPWPKL